MRKNLAFYIDQAFKSLKLYGFGEAKHQLKNMEGKFIMENNENLVLDGTENVEATATEEIVEQVETTETVEETAKTYTEEEVNQIVGKRLARERAKIQRENNRKYGQLENVLRAGTGKESVEEITDTFAKFYEGKGVTIPKEPEYSDNDIKLLAKADADAIINLGFEEVVDEADRLNELGAENMTAREKALFVALTDHINNTETSRELDKIGVSKELYESREFKDFAKKFNSDTPITEIYEIYNQTQPKKQIKPMGSIKSTTVDNGAVKDFYTKEEAMKFTVEDFNKNPALFEAVEKSMRKWK